MTDETKTRWQPSNEFRWLALGHGRILQQKWLGYPHYDNDGPFALLPYPPPEPSVQWRLIPVVDAKGMSDDEKGITTNPFAPRERPQKSIRLMTDAERRAAGLDPNGGFDGPTGAD